MLPSLLVALSLTQCLKDADPLASGLHTRLVTHNGPIHLWCQDRGEPEVFVVYVHGYFDSVDDAFGEHGLIDQFRRSGLNAMFAMIEAPKGPKELVRWPSFAELRSELERQLGRPLPKRVVALGHSGGSRTLREWAAAGSVDDIVLLDAFYGDTSKWTTFVGRPGSRLRLVGVLTHQKAEAWKSSLPGPALQRVESQRAKATHMGVITDGQWIPELLRRTPPGTSYSDPQVGGRMAVEAPRRQGSRPEACWWHAGGRRTKPPGMRRPPVDHQLVGSCTEL